MPNKGRRNLLKVIGLSPALLVPWKTSTQPAPVEPETLELEEALRRVDWTALHAGSSYSMTGCAFRPPPGWQFNEDDDGAL